MTGSSSPTRSSLDSLHRQASDPLVYSLTLPLSDEFCVEIMEEWAALDEWVQRRGWENDPWGDLLKRITKDHLPKLPQATQCRCRVLMRQGTNKGGIDNSTVVEDSMNSWILLQSYTELNDSISTDVFERFVSVLVGEFWHWIPQGTLAQILDIPTSRATEVMDWAVAAAAAGGVCKIPRPRTEGSTEVLPVIASSSSLPRPIEEERSWSITERVTGEQPCPPSQPCNPLALSWAEAARDGGGVALIPDHRERTGLVRRWARAAERTGTAFVLAGMGNWVHRAAMAAAGTGNGTIPRGLRYVAGWQQAAAAAGGVAMVPRPDP